jgi:ribosomal protein L37AE/L43A
MEVRQIYKVKCNHCGYIWWTRSNLKVVTCPGCGLKTPNPQFKEVKGKETW